MSKLTSFPKYLGNKNHKFQQRLCKGESSARFMVFAQIAGTPEGGGGREAPVSGRSVNPIPTRTPEGGGPDYAQHITTVKLAIKELLNKEQTGFKELFTDYQPFYTINLLLNKELWQSRKCQNLALVNTIL